MADLTNSSWSEADSSNTQPAPNGVPPGILPSELGGSLRAVMGAMKRWHSRSNAMLSSTGSANAYVLTYAVGPTAYTKGEKFLFFANHTNTAAATLNINGLGVRPILRADGFALAEGEIVGGQVVTVVFDGANFLAENIISKDFKTGISVVRNTDAIIMLEDTGAPATSYRRKQVFSTRNDGNAGNSFLFRQTRPSDGAVEDFYLKGGTGGTIWTTGNFNPDLKANLTGGTFTNNVVTRANNGSGSVALSSGTADRSGYIEFRDKDNTRHGYIGWSDGNNILLNAEKGDFNLVGGTPRIGGNQIWHAGNFNPDLRALLNNPVTFTGIGFTSRDSYIYADTGTNNLVLRTGTAANPKYTVIDADGTFRPSGTIRAPGEIIAAGNITVGSGQHYSQINMADSDEGTRYIHNNSNLIGFLGKGGDWIFRVDDNGAVWTKQLGDLNGRVEQRAADWARQEGNRGRDEAKAFATIEANRGRDEANNNSNANFFNKTAGTTQQVSNLAAFNAGAIDIVRGGHRRERLEVGTDGYFRFKNGDTDAASHAFGPGGDIWTAQFGDLHNRIEDRANAWSATRRDEANNNTNANFFNKTTGTAQQVSNIPSFNASAIDIVRGGVLRARWAVDGGGTTILQNGDNGDNLFYVTNGGALWCKQFGDVNNRIEDRGSAWGQHWANQRIAKTGDTMTGDLTVNKAYPTLNMLYGGVRHVGWQVRENAQTYLWDHTLGNWQMRVDADGGVVARGNLYSGNGTAIVATDGNVHGSVWGGWLSNRIGGIDNAVNNRLVKTGDTMTGDLTISKANPSLNFFYSGVYASRLWVGNDAVFRYSHNEGDGDQFRISPGGAVWTKQLGDLHNRIEDRAYAWAATRQANLGYTPVEQGGGAYMGANKIRIGWDGPASACRLQVDNLQLERILTRNWINPIIDVRLAYAGDLDNNWNGNNDFTEPYGGAVLTSRQTVNTPAGIMWGGGRWRYLQKQDSYGNWYTVGYV